GDSWLGIDFGPIGATLLYAALWGFVIYLAKYAGELFPEEWAPAERRAWVSLVFVALISLHMLNLLAALPELGIDADQMRNSATRPMMVNLGLLGVGWIVVSSALRRQDAGDVRLDERDLRIAHSAARFAEGALVLLIVC